MAWARKLPSGRWQGQYRDPSGITSSTGTFLRKTDAKNAAEEEERQIRLDEWIDPELRRILFSEYVKRWAKTKGNVRERTRINVEGRLRNHILPAFGELPIGAIRPSLVRGWVADLESRLAPSTVKAIYWTLRQIMATAEIDRVVRRSPCVGVELPKEISTEEMHFLSPDQIATVADAHDQRFRAAILTDAYTGLRAGELWALKVERLNLLRRSLEVVESLSEVRGRLVTGPTKTNKRRRVSLPPFLVDALAEHIKRYPSRDGYVFTATEGGPVRHRNYMERHFGPALARAGLPDAVRFHDLRHSCAAILIAQGWGPKPIQERLGHASIRTTLDRYGHLFEGHDADLMDGLDATIRGTRPADSAAHLLHDRRAEGS